MTPAEQAHWRRVREIFEKVSEAEPCDRDDLMAQHCMADDALRHEVKELLSLRNDSGLALDASPALTPEQQRRTAEAIRAAAPAQDASPRFDVSPRYAAETPIGDRYRIVRFLAHGGMGEVYEAVDQVESRPVALKFVRRIPADQTQLEARFQREVRMARKIDHSNICRIFDLAEHEGEPFCAMELLHGETLAAKLSRDGQFAPQDALPIAQQLCDGLGTAHRAGVLHRDLKPGNIFLVDGRAVIIDFGLAAAVVRDTGTRETGLTATGAVIGTLAYTAPEQLDGGDGAEAADLYSLCVIFYEMLTGAKPHDAKSPFRLAAQKARESHRNRGSGGIAAMPAVWREVITRGLNARPKDRYRNAAEM